MKLKVIFFSIIYLISHFLYVESQQDLLSQGKELFLQEHYQDAFDVYQKISDKGFAVLYNMSLCCLQQNKKAEAILYAKRAEKHAVSYKELTRVEDLLADQNEEVETKGWLKLLALFYKKVILTISILFVQIVVLFGLIGLILCWYLQLYRKYRWISIFGLVLWLIFYYILNYKINFIEQKNGVIMQEVVPVYAGPDNSFYEKAKLNQFEYVKIIDQHDRYYKIKTDKLVGWIDSNNIELV